MKLKTKIDKLEDLQNISGVKDSNLLLLNDYFKTDIVIRNNEIFTSSTDNVLIEKLEHIFVFLLTISQNKVSITKRDILYILNALSDTDFDNLLSLYTDHKLIMNTNSGKGIYAKTLSQKAYLQALNEKDLVFSIGPAGTGKTYLAVVHAVNSLKEGKIKKIILTRPAVEAGESLGFLPGDLKEKVDPYLTPLYDALNDLLGIETVNTLIEKKVIEIAPLAYMRGRTLDNAYVILDEAQNTTKMQMKMFLTRLGFNSKMVVTGDITQVDLPRGIASGLKDVFQILTDIKEIALIEFDNKDVVRHPLVQKIIERYEMYEN